MFYALACAMQDTTVITPGFAYRTRYMVLCTAVPPRKFFCKYFPENDSTTALQLHKHSKGSITIAIRL